MPNRITDEQLLIKVGGRFKLTTLIQKRLDELRRGAVKLVETDSTDLLEVVAQEIAEGKISLELEAKESAEAEQESAEPF